MSTLSELALRVHRVIWYPVHVALGLEQPGIILPAEFAPSLSQCDEKRTRMRRPTARAS